MHPPMDELDIFSLPMGIDGVAVNPSADQTIERIRRSALLADQVPFFIIDQFRLSGDPVELKKTQLLKDRYLFNDA